MLYYSKFLDIVDSLEQCLVDIAAANSNCTLKENDHWQTTFKDFLYQVQNGLKPTICSRKFDSFDIFKQITYAFCFLCTLYINKKNLSMF